MSSGTSDEPMKPVAPVIKTRICFSFRPVLCLTDRHESDTNGGNLRIVPRLPEEASGCKNFLHGCKGSPIDRQKTASGRAAEPRMYPEGRQAGVHAVRS